jgi:hypothetical protein
MRDEQRNAQDARRLEPVVLVTLHRIKNSAEPFSRGDL